MRRPSSEERGRPRLPCRLPALLLVATLGACAEPEPAHHLIPAPASVRLVAGDSAIVWLPTRIVVDPGASELLPIAEHLAGLIGNWVETRPPIIEPGQSSPAPTLETRPRPADSLAVDIRLTLEGSDSSLGEEGYELTVSGDGIEVRGSSPAGVFYGVQTLRQWMPPAVEYTAAFARPWVLPGVVVRDSPRNSWRGAMLDVSRHCLTADEVKRFIDLMVPLKLNRLHLHLSDDQGFRLDIPGWPDLARIGGSTEVGGGPGGYYTMDEYADLVAYADERFIVVVPEIDVPGHVSAILASYPKLNCDGRAKDLYTRTEVGISVLCVDEEVTYELLDDVVREISARTSGPWFHMGGDEVPALPEEEYEAFVIRMAEIVRSHGKQMVGWEEIAIPERGEDPIIQLWRPFWSEDVPPELAERGARLREAVARSVNEGARFILSPADRFYLDMKYDSTTVPGLAWAGLVDERRAYDWSIRDDFGVIPEDAALGVEAALWGETLGTLEEFEFMAFPRLAAVAEIGWTPVDQRDWASFRVRLGAYGPRWSAQGVNFRRSPGIPWMR